ncbi:V-type ATP synthase subunit I [Anaerosporobacter faecicola]|uniref:V-type ATP synthase subunit I n=1 Tax=Anaerosporobacter faecicola TaxID=2718714 RepID=UPI001438E899|nr:V-type ATPase 116kDa subunit family protein [Anaerosporobacter faecicola]
MIEKMKFLSITGPKNDIDRVANTYLSKYEMHLENALSELNTVRDLKPFVEMNPYRDLLSKSDELVQKIDNDCTASHKSMTPSEAADVIANAFSMLEDLNAQKKELKDTKTHYKELLHTIEPFRMLNYDMKKIMEFKFIKFRFGRISHEFYNKFSKYVYENLNTVFYECDSDEDYVWGIYFVPATSSVKIDAIYASLHFERIFIPNEYEGTPEEAHEAISQKISSITKNIKDLSIEIKKKLDAIGPELLLAHNTLVSLTKNHNIRKLAACTKESGVDHNSDNLVFYIICGWMTLSDANAFLKEIEGDSNVYCISEEVQDDIGTKPPTKLKNPKIFKPFEMFIRMYGVPAYNEIDPTLFVAITYSLIFGIMFGDVGQGLCLVIGGALFYKIKKMNLGAIVSLAGIFSTIFGFMYGSIFGYEDMIPHLWMKPMDNIMSILITAIVFGAFLIIVAMVLNIINAVKSKDYGRLLFDTNGVAGLLFYGGIMGCVALIFTGHALPGAIVLALLFGIPLLLMFFKEPLERKIEKKKDLFPDGKGMFVLTSFFELFEVLLSYASNTISFLRVGAFALSHGAMMGVVLMFAGAESGIGNIPIMIIGNIFVAAMEGLIVGIQVLRLEYYEMFSRFYRGNGKEFKPYKNN